MSASTKTRETVTAVVTDVTLSAVTLRTSDGRRLRYSPGAGYREWGVPFLRSALPGRTYTFTATLEPWSDWNGWHMSRPVLVAQGAFCPLDQLDVWPHDCRRTCSGYWWDPYTRTEWDQGGGDREFRVTSHDEKCPKYKEESV